MSCCSLPAGVKTIHTVTREQLHLRWDATVPPVVTVSSGEIVTFDCGDASNEQITPETTVADLKDTSKVSFDKMDPVNGPVFVSDAKVGDTLEIEIVDLQHGDHGWTAIFPEFGLLHEHFKDTHALKLWDLRRDGGLVNGKAKFKDGIWIPVEPFCGEIGVAPAKSKGSLSTIPPDTHGGNVDTKHITKGAKVYLPVFCDGALFSIGDGHAAQGDGEICGTAIETAMSVTVKLTVIKRDDDGEGGEMVASPPTMQFKTAGPLCKRTNTDAGYYCTTGIGPDLMEATKQAALAMIDWLVSKRSPYAQTGQLTREEAYMLCSVCGDMKINEVVDVPHWNVGCYLPLCIFENP